jgi:hypothetical protein
MSIFEINGKKYTARQQPKRKSQMSKVELMAITIGVHDFYGLGSNYTREFPKLTNGSLIDEFRLVQEKKSCLTSAERNMVENQFHRLYMEVL